MILTEINEYKQTLRVYINSLGAFGAFAFSILQFLTDHTFMASVSLIGGCYFSTVLYFLLHKNQYLWKGRGHLLIILPIVLLAIYLNIKYGIYWVYVGVVFLFLVLELWEATISVTVFIALCFYLITPQFEQDVLYRIFSTVILVGLFSFCFSFLIERLLNSLNLVATRDPLTKALNRHTFHTAIELAQDDHQRYKVTGILFLFDLDHFKRINDQYGHIAGDSVLREIAKIIHKRVRKSDQFFRYGGEEFAILLRHTSLQNAAFLAEELRTQIKEHTFTDGIKVTISGGLSEVQEGDDVNAWIDRSDTALYEAKEAGRNCNKINVTELRMLLD